jgi:hypothetical protein
MNTNVKLFLLVLMAGGIVLGIYSCNKAKSDKQSDSGKQFRHLIRCRWFKLPGKTLRANFHKSGQ